MLRKEDSLPDSGRLDRLGLLIVPMNLLNDRAGKQVGEYWDIAPWRFRGRAHAAYEDAAW
jgi:hypothetical protein